MDVNNQGLNLPSNLQNLNVRNELLSTEVGSGASSAYSLRDLTGNNLDCVRVRREPEDSTDGIDNEKKFACQAVQVGELQDWVNGKLEHTLPVDIDSDNCVVAYSLRKVNSSYSGDAVRIRRTSDNVEVNVAFDSDDKVSASSPITDGGTELTPDPDADLGSTTATTLGGFINHSEDFGNFRVDNEWSDNLLAFSSVGKTSFSVEAKSLGSFNSTDTVRVTAPITNVIAEPQASITKFKTTFTIDSISGEGNGDATDGAFYVKGANTASGNGSWNFHNSPDGAGGDETFKFTSAGTYTVEGYGEDETDAFNLAFRTFSFIIYSGTKVSVSNVSMEVLNDCTVHTLYNQSGLNNAVQETSANQPKIAENGALLADGIEFDGDNDALNFTDLTLTNASIFTVLDIDGTENLQIILGGSSTTSTATMIPMMQTSSTTTQVYKNATVGGAEQGSSQFRNATGITLANRGDAYSELATKPKMLFTMLDVDVASDKVLDGIGQTPSDASTWGLKGTMEELIIYNSDQTDDRFKIESNINNYYGLYNDEYEWDDATNTEWQNNVTDGTTTFTANGKDGFTITATGENKSSFKYKITSPSTASNDYYKVSFNVDDPDGLFTSAFLRLTATGAGATSVAITNGFNSMSLRTGANFEYMSINSDASGSSKTATLSDFKISRIARDGFVETLYDQSGNEDDMTQASAGSQPAIVQNGGQVKLICGKPAFKGDGSNDHLEASYFYSAGEVTAMSTFSVVSNSKDTGEEKAIISAGSGVSTTYRGFMVSLDKNQNANPFEQRVANGSGTKETSLLDTSQDGDILGSTFFTKDGTHLVKATTEDGTTTVSANITVGAFRESTTSGKLRIGASRTFAIAQEFNFPIAEVIVYRADLRGEGIEDKINQFYNIG